MNENFLSRRKEKKLNRSLAGGNDLKLFHLSDLHIGKQLHHYNLAAEQREMLAQIVALAESGHPDAILIAGDIYL